MSLVDISTLCDERSSDDDIGLRYRCRSVELVSSDEKLDFRRFTRSGEVHFIFMTCILLVLRLRQLTRCLSGSVVIFSSAVAILLVSAREIQLSAPSLLEWRIGVQPRSDVQSWQSGG